MRYIIYEKKQNIPQQHLCLLIWQCVCWTSPTVGLQFFIPLRLLFALISTWHRLPAFKHTVNLLIKLSLPAVEIGTKTTRFVHFSPPKKNELQETRFLGHMFPAQLIELGIWWIMNLYQKVPSDLLMCWPSWPVPLDPRCYGNQRPAVGSFESSALRVWPRVLYPSGARLPSKVHLEHLKTTSLAMNRTKQHFLDSENHLFSPFIALKMPNSTCRSTLRIILRQ